MNCCLLRSRLTLARRAYEITTLHKKEPPPKEILEDISARGADLLTRTVENFKPHGARDSSAAANGDDSEAAGEEGEQKQAQPDKMDVDDAGSAGRYARGEHPSAPLYAS
jgi:chromatin structure-remodeling complex subunit RSC9